MQPDRTTQNVRIAKVLGVLFILIVLVLSGYSYFMNRNLRFQGISPSPKNLGTSTNVVLKFNKPISNRESVMASLQVTPLVKMSVLVEGNSVTIIPIDSFTDTEYRVSIPLIKSGSQTIKNFTTSFKPNPTAPSTSEKTNIDLDDIPLRTYPDLIKVSDEKTNYKINYALDGDIVVFDLLLIESQERGVSEAQAIQKLKDHNTEARAFISTLGIPKDKYIIRYDDEVQAELIYGTAGAPTTN